MRRYGLLLLVLVLATASLLAAAAYSTATIVNAADLTVVSTNAALVTLEPGNDLDHTAYLSGGRLFIDFDKGYGGVQKGLQPGSVYCWEDLFWIRGRSNNWVNFTVELYATYNLSTGASTPFSSSDISITIAEDTGLCVYPAAGGVLFVLNNVNQGNWDTNENDPYFNKGIDVKIEVSKTATMIPHLMEVVVKAVRHDGK